LSQLSPNNDNLTLFKAALNSGSKVAIWRLYCYLIAVAHYTHELLWDFFKAEIQTIVANAPTGTLPWYRLRILEFQFGDSLDFINEKYQYPTIDPTKKVVKLCAVEDRPDGVVIIKVADLDGSLLPTPFTAPQKASLEGYISKIRFAGTKFLVVSTAPDLLKLIGTIYYDPIHDLTQVTLNVEAAITTYLNNLPFNGVFKITSLIDAVQAVTGVVDFTIGTIQGKYGAVPYVTINRTYTAQAGYLKIDPAFPLSTNLTYSASQV
jgi:hypothetical protein